MKIFHPLLCYYPSQAGGPANTLYWLNNALVKKNYRTNVLSTSFGLKSYVNLELESYSEDRHKVKFLDSKVGFIREGTMILKDSNIIQFSSIFFPPTLPLLIVALGSNKKIIISPRGELYPAALGINPFQKKVWLRIIKSFQHKIFFHATNEYEREIIGKQFPNAAGLEVIPNYIELPQRINIEVITNQLLFIGRINPIKNIDVLLNSVAIIKRKYNKNIRLSIAGEARLDYEKGYFMQLKKLIIKLDLQSNVTFLGHIDKEEKQKYIASSFALILPSKSENFGNVVIEALAQGTPVIASRNTPWEILDNTETGYWIEAEPEKISAAVIEMHGLDAKDYSLMRERAYKLCLENFDISTNVHHWENFYKKIIN